MPNKELDHEAIADEFLRGRVASPQPYGKLDHEAIADELLYGKVAAPKPTNLTVDQADADAINYFGRNIDKSELLMARDAVPKAIVDNPSLLLQGKEAENDIKRKYREIFPILRPEGYQEPPISFQLKAVLNNGLFNSSNQRAYEYEAKAQGFMNPQEYSDYLDRSYGYRAKRMFGAIGSTIGTLGAYATAFSVANADKLIKAFPMVGPATDITEHLYTSVLGDKAGPALLDDLRSMKAQFESQGIEFAQEMQRVSTEAAPTDMTIPEKLVGAGVSSMAFLVPGMGIVRGASALGMVPAVARTIGAGGMTILESGVEDGGVVLEALNNGKSMEEAEARGNAAFLLNLPLNFVLDRMGISVDEGSKLWKFINKGGAIAKGIKGYAAGFATEGAQEAAQLAISEPLGKDRWPTLGEFTEEFVYGGAFGGVATALQALGSKPYAKKPGEPASVSDVVDDIADGKLPKAAETIAENIGVPPEKVIEVAKADRLATDEDKAVFNEIAKYAQENAQDISEVEITDADIEGVVSGEETYQDVIDRKITEPIVEDEVTAVDTAAIETSVAQMEETNKIRQEIVSEAKGILSLEESTPRDIVQEGVVDIRGATHAFTATLKDGRKVEILWGGKQRAVSAKARAGYEGATEEAAVGGQSIILPESAIISISKDAESKTFRHEWYHTVEAMALSPEEVQIVADRYSDGDVAGQASKEARANAYKNWDGRTKTSHGLFEKLRDFARKLKAYITGRQVRTAESIFSDISTGRILEAEKTAKKEGVSYSIEEPIDSTTVDTLSLLRSEIDKAALKIIENDNPGTREELRQATKAYISVVTNEVSPDLRLDKSQIINELRQKIRGAKTVRQVIREYNDEDVLKALELTERELKAEFKYGQRAGQAFAKKASDARMQALKDRYRNLISERARRDKETRVKNKLRSEIFKLLKNSQTRVEDGIRKGKYTPEIQRVLNNVYQAYKTSQEIRARELGAWHVRYDKTLKDPSTSGYANSKHVKAALNAKLDAMIATATKKEIDARQFELDKMDYSNPIERLGKLTEIQVLDSLQGRRVKDMKVSALTETRDSLKELIDLGKEFRQRWNLQRERQTNQKISDTKEVLKEGAEQEIDMQRLIEAQQQKKEGFFKGLLELGTGSYQGILEQLSLNSKSDKLIKAMELYPEKRKFWKLHVDTVASMNDLYSEAYGTKTNHELIGLLHSLDKQVKIGTVQDWKGKTYQYKISRAEAMQRALEFLNPELKAILIEKNNITESEYEAIMSVLTEQDMNFVVKVHKLFDRAYELMNEKYRIKYGTDLSRTEYYVPIVREYESNRNNLDEKVHDLRTISPTATHERTKAKHPLKRQSLVANLQRHMMNAVFYNVYADKIDELSKIIYDPEIRATIKTRWGDKTYDRLKTHLGSFVNGGKLDTGGKYYSIFKPYLGRFGVAQLALKPKLALTNLTAFVGYMDAVPAHKFIRYVATDSIQMFEHHKFLKENSSYYKWRMESFIDRDINEWMNSPEAKSWIDRPDLTNLLMFNIKLGDQAGILLGGYPTYKYYFDKYYKKMPPGMPKHIAIEEAKKKAIEKFEEVSEKTQQSSSMDMLSIAEKSDNPLVRAFIQFTSQPRQYMLAEITAIKEIYHGKDVAMNLQRLAVYHIIAPLLFQMMSDFVKGESEEEKKNKRARAIIWGPFNNLFVLGSWADTLLSSALGMERFQTNHDLAVFSIFKDLDKSMKDWDKDKEWKAMGHLVDMSGKIQGLPLGTIGNVFSGLAAEFSEDDINGVDWADVLRILGGESRESIERAKKGNKK